MKTAAPGLLLCLATLVVIGGCASTPASVSPRVDSTLLGDIPEEAAFRMLATRTRESASASGRYAPSHCQFSDDGEIHYGHLRSRPQGSYVHALESRARPGSLRVFIYPSDRQTACIVSWDIPAPYMKEWQQIMTAAMSLGMRYYCDEFECVMQEPAP